MRNINSKLRWKSEQTRGAIFTTARHLYVPRTTRNIILGLHGFRASSTETDTFKATSQELEGSIGSEVNDLGHEFYCFHERGSRCNLNQISEMFVLIIARE